MLAALASRELYCICCFPISTAAVKDEFVVTRKIYVSFYLNEKDKRSAENTHESHPFLAVMGTVPTISLLSLGFFPGFQNIF